MGFEVGAVGVFEVFGLWALDALDVVVVDESVGFAVSRVGGIDPGVAVFAGLGRDKGFILVVPGELEPLFRHLVNCFLCRDWDDFADVANLAAKYFADPDQHVGGDVSALPEFCRSGGTDTGLLLESRFVKVTVDQEFPQGNEASCHWSPPGRSGRRPWSYRPGSVIPFAGNGCLFNIGSMVSANQEVEISERVATSSSATRTL